MSNSKEEILLSNSELDTIGEVMNISMGAAATAISTMLDRPVNITTPQIKQDRLKDVDCSSLEPAIMVKIRYVEGIEGNNIILLRKRDMQVILNLLMGNEDPVEDGDFEFDEMSMSAACEVMNQMMGASATALSELLGKSINISTPESVLVESVPEAFSSFKDIAPDDEVIAISFELDISKVLNTTFTSFLPLKMAKKITQRMLRDITESATEQQVPAQQAPVQQAPVQQASEQQPPVQQPPMQQPPVQQPPVQQAPVQQPPVQQKTMPDGMPMYQQMMPPYSQINPWSMPYPPMYGAYGYGTQPNMPGQMAGMTHPAAQETESTAGQNVVNVKKVEFPSFNTANGTVKAFGDTNLNLLMNIPLEVSVVIGRTKRKIRDIIEFGQGTVVELDKQTGAPAEIIVNGQLLAYGDVVVIDDNFGVRVTEIVGTQELLESLANGK